MKQRKLRSYVMPTIYVIILVLVFGTVSLVSTLLKTDINYSYSTGILDNTIKVVDTTENLTVQVIKPYVSTEVEIDKYYYDITDDEEKQTESLIYFEGTYMKNTGVLYKSDETFDVIAVLDGTVYNITEDELLGNVVEIEHSNNLRTIYYSLADVSVSVGDILNQGDFIATSGSNKVTDNKNSLLFEVYFNGALIDPEDFYTMDVSNFN